MTDLFISLNDFLWSFRLVAVVGGHRVVNSGLAHCLWRHPPHCPRQFGIGARDGYWILYIGYCHHRDEH